MLFIWHSSLIAPNDMISIFMMARHHEICWINWFCGPLILCSLKVLDLHVSLVFETHREVGV